MDMGLLIMARTKNNLSGRSPVESGLFFCPYAYVLADVWPLGAFYL